VAEEQAERTEESLNATKAFFIAAGEHAEVNAASLRPQSGRNHQHILMGGTCSLKT